MRISDWSSDVCSSDLDFATPPLDSMKVTLAHEFLHLSQFSTDVTEDQWLMEGTATWIEEQIHDDINDNRQYLSMSSLRVQQMPLDHPDGWYGNWIFFEHLTKSYGAGIVPEIWHEARSTREIGSASGRERVGQYV